MCDHILSTAILQGLTDVPCDCRGVTLAIDRRTQSPLIDPDDATWVETRENGFIAHIGKGLSTFNALDCGAFLATPALAEAIQEAIDKGKSGSLSDGMQVLADRGQAATLEVADAWWMDVDDPKAHAMAEELLDRNFSILGNAALTGLEPAELDVLA